MQVAVRAFVLIAIILLIGTVCMALSISDGNLILVNGMPLRLNLNGEKRVAENAYQRIDYSISNSDSQPLQGIDYSSPEMDVNVSFTPVQNMAARGWLVNVDALFHQETYLRELRLTLDFNEPQSISTLKGPQAIHNENVLLNERLIFHTDKAIQYSRGDSRFWIVASNYEGCVNVESVTSNDIFLYDFRAHWMRRYNPNADPTYKLRDTMYRQAGDSFRWAFILFEEEPLLLDINRWPNGKRAALTISNDADGSNSDRLRAVFFGSNNPANPKYLTQGFVANGIRVSNTVFGANQSLQNAVWMDIMNSGNTIGYHTYANTTDPPGTNATALLQDLLPYNIRMWIDHALHFNPEDIGYDGLDPESPSYVADVINQSGIDYIWAADTPPTNPFNAYDEAWRLPHLQYEVPTLTRPIWFFGRTRAEAWEYTNGSSMLTMKYQITPDNLDNLLEKNGLHISYTHLCFGENSTTTAFFITAPNGDLEIRPEVNDMLLMLKYYSDHRGLWIDTTESIFDRMLAIDQVKVRQAVPSGITGIYNLTLVNESDINISDFNFGYRDQHYCIASFPAQSTATFFVNVNKADPNETERIPYSVSYKAPTLYISDRNGSLMQPLEVRIYNLRGQRILTHSNHTVAAFCSIPFSGYPQGLYLMRIKAVNEKARYLKFNVLK